MFVGILAILSMSAVTVSAVTITDDIDDVWYRWYEPTTGTEELPLVANKPNIDITSVSYTITGSELTLTMTIDGTFEDSELIGYTIYFGIFNNSLYSPDSRYYAASYSNGSAYYSTWGMEEFSYGIITNPISGNTFTATFEIADLDPTFELWGFVMEFLEAYEEGDTSYSWDWMDVVPNTLMIPDFSGDTGEDDEPTDDDDVEPGGDDDEITTGNESYIPPDEKGEIPVNEIVIVTSAAAGAAVLLGVLTTELGKNKFYWFLTLLGPLYLRTVKEEVFDNQKRLCMYNHIAENQPVVYAEIKKTCNLSDGEINWHARMMIQLDLIKTERKGFHLFFYLAKSPRLPPEEFIRLTDVQRSVLGLIVKKPGITQAEIVEKIGLKQQNISYNLLKLEEKGKIRVEKKGKIKSYYPIKKDSSST